MGKYYKEENEKEIEKVLKIDRDFEIHCRNSAEKTLIEEIKDLSLYPMSLVCGGVSTRSEAVDAILQDLDYMNSNLEDSTNIIIKQNMMILKRLEEISERLCKLEKDSTKAN